MTTIHNTTSFKVDSWGHGLAVLFTNKAANREVFFQGDDASCFLSEIDHSDAMGWPYERTFANLWSDYEEHSQEPSQR
jgi:hypothetical protein